MCTVAYMTDHHFNQAQYITRFSISWSLSGPIIAGMAAFFHFPDLKSFIACESWPSLLPAKCVETKHDEESGGQQHSFHLSFACQEGVYT